MIEEGARAGVIVHFVVHFVEGRKAQYIINIRVVSDDGQMSSERRHTH